MNTDDDQKRLCEIPANAWYGKAPRFIVQNMENSYEARFETATGVGHTYRGAAAADSIINELNFKGDALREFIKEEQ